MTDTTETPTTEQPVQDLPSVSQLQRIIRDIPDPSADPRDARQAAYHLNRQRAVVSHSSKALQELELACEDALAMREVLVRRNQRVVAEIENIDVALAGYKAGIAALRGSV
jgi:hypothetical protein